MLKSWASCWLDSRPVEGTANLPHLSACSQKGKEGFHLFLKDEIPLNIIFAFNTLPSTNSGTIATQATVR